MIAFKQIKVIIKYFTIEIEVILVWIIDKIKELKNKNRPRIKTAEVVRYNTTLVYIPKYDELTDEERRIVDYYMTEVDLTKIENIITYGNKLYEYANVNTELLLNSLYKITETPSEWKVNKMTDEEILKQRLDEMTNQEEFELYRTELKKIEKESILRTVALEKIYIRNQKNFRQFGIFEKAERLKRKNEREQLETAIERMKINKKIIEQQTQSITNTINSSRNNCTIYRYI